MAGRQIVTRGKTSSSNRQKPVHKRKIRIPSKDVCSSDDEDTDTELEEQMEETLKENVPPTPQVAAKGNEGETNMEPEDMVIHIGKGDDDCGKTLSELTICPNVARDGMLTVVQKSNLLNWAEERLFPGSKIMTFDEANNNDELRKAVCRAIGINEVGWAVVGTEAIKRLRTAMSDRLTVHRKVVKSLYLAYLRKHKDQVDDFEITKQDCALMFRAVAYDGADEVMCEKWKLVGQCLSRVCSKRCTWSNLEVRAAAPNVCAFTTVAEEAIVYWIFVTEGDGWVRGFKNVSSDSDTEDGGDTTSGTNTTGRKNGGGQHKTVKYLKHWWQLFGIVKLNRENRTISESWDNAWMTFAMEELEFKKTKSDKKKRKIKDVLPKFEDVLGVGVSAMQNYSSYSLVIGEDLPSCTNRAEI